LNLYLVASKSLGRGRINFIVKNYNNELLALNFDDIFTILDKLEIKEFKMNEFLELHEQNLIKIIKPKPNLKPNEFDYKKIKTLLNTNLTIVKIRYIL
jgi:hypothetical protein